VALLEEVLLAPDEDPHVEDRPVAQDLLLLAVGLPLEDSDVLPLDAHGRPEEGSGGVSGEVEDLLSEIDRGPLPVIVDRRPVEDAHPAVLDLRTPPILQDLTPPRHIGNFLYTALLTRF
jgi:hypothetical protein